MKTSEPDSLTLQQIAGVAALAVVSSAVAGVSVFIAVRLRRKKIPSDGTHGSRWPAVRPRVSETTATAFPNHFSENLVVPGFPRTGEETTRQDAAVSDNSEGI